MRILCVSYNNDDIKHRMKISTCDVKQRFESVSVISLVSWFDHLTLKLFNLSFFITTFQLTNGLHQVKSTHLKTSKH